MKIAVLMGGLSPERNISMLSGRAVTQSLRQLGHTVTALDPSKGAAAALTDADLEAATNASVSAEELAAMRKESFLEFVNSGLLEGVDVAFIMLHGYLGEDGYIQSLLDLKGVPYTGSEMLASAIAMDKGLAKLLFQVSGIPTAYWVNVTPEFADDLEALEEVRREINGPMVIKPNDGGSTVGMTIVESGIIDEMVSGIREAAKYTKHIMIERYVKGRELTVTVLGGDALPVIEIVPHDGYYDYENKYTKGRTDYICPADLPEHVRDHVMSLAVTAHHVIGCRGFSRVDFLLDDENMPICLEVNTIPGFTELSLVPMAAREAGIEFGALCEEIIRLSTGLEVSAS